MNARMSGASAGVAGRMSGDMAPRAPRTDAAKSSGARRAGFVPRQACGRTIASGRITSRMSPEMFALIVGPLHTLAMLEHVLEYLIEAVLVVAALWVGWQLNRRLAHRTRELDASEERWRMLFQQTGVA